MNRLLARLVLVALAMSLLFPLPAAAVDPNRALTQYVHRIWQMQQGLPQPSIYGMVQDGDGFLWLGTQAGLVRFDGVRFTTPDAVPFGNTWVQALAVDGHDDLWVATGNSGVFRVHAGVATRYSRAQGLPSDTARAILVDRAGDVWVATDNGVARISQAASGGRNGARGFPAAGADGRRITVYTRSKGPAANETDALCQRADGTIWVGGRGATLSIWNGAGWARYTMASLPATASVRAILAARDGTLWIGTSEGLVHLASNRETLLTIRERLADNSVLGLAESRDGSIWVGTQNGFSRVRGEAAESFGTENGLSQSTVYAICEDREGSIWVGTKHGLNQFLDGRTVPYTTSEGLPTNDTGPVIQDPRGNIWVGTLGAGLARFDGRRFTVVAARNGLASNTIRALAIDGGGRLWVGTDQGLNCLRDGRVEATYTAAQGLPSSAIRSLFADRSGALWIGTSAGVAVITDVAHRSHGGLRVARPEPPPRSPGESDDPPRVPGGPVLAFAQDSSGRIWESVAGALFERDDGEMRDPSGGVIHGADAIYAGPDGTVWVGTSGDGLWLVRAGKAVRYSMQDGLFDDEIYGIVEDAHDRLWMACSKGVFSVPRSDLLKFAAGTVRTVVSTPYSPTDALRTVECRPGVQPPVARMHDGRLWFSTIHGLLVIDPNHLEHRFPAPHVVVEDATVNGEHVSPFSIGQLAPGRNNVAFSYTAPSFVASARITFRYILDGFDRDWTNAGTRREAFYTNLPPGSFHFRVTARNVDGTSAAIARPLAFTIAPRLYQHTWFIPLCAAVGALVAWSVYRLRVRRLRAQFALVLAERGRIARELHDTLLQGFSGITMEMQALAGRMRNAAERRALEEIIHDAGTTLGEARRSLAGLRSPRSQEPGLAAAIARAAHEQAEGKDVRVRLHLDHDLPQVRAEVGYNLLRIAQEAIANAARHSGSATIDVTLHKTPAGLELEVRDAGEGFEGDEASYVQLGHFGLTGMRERANEIGADFTLTTGRGSGTTVRVVVPAASLPGNEATPPADGAEPMLSNPLDRCR